MAAGTDEPTSTEAGGWSPTEIAMSERIRELEAELVEVADERDEALAHCKVLGDDGDRLRAAADALADAVESTDQTHLDPTCGCHACQAVYGAVDAYRSLRNQPANRAVPEGDPTMTNEATGVDDASEGPLSKVGERRPA